MDIWGASNLEQMKGLSDEKKIHNFYFTPSAEFLFFYIVYENKRNQIYGFA